VKLRAWLAWALWALLPLLAVTCPKENDGMVTVTENLQLLAMSESSPRLLPVPAEPTDQPELLNAQKLLNLDDPPGTPDDGTTIVESISVFANTWERDTFTLQPATVRAGVISALVGKLRVNASTSSLARGVATLDGVTVTGAEFSFPTGGWDDLTLDIPHPTGGVWTYEELERAAIGYDVWLKQFAPVSQLTQFYPQVEAETAAGAVGGSGVPVSISALAHVLTK